jgi:tRNA threonylcarbamoyladenosine biosynthesis protein TsaE
MKTLLPDSEATRKFGVALGRSLPAGTVILLEGDLGAGKLPWFKALLKV